MENLTQRTVLFLSQEHYIEICINAFIRDRKASNLSPRTLKFYKEKLDKFASYCFSQEIKYVTQIKPDTIRSYMLYMAEVRNNNKGNIHAFYRSIRAFLYWYENEYEPEDWKNPIKKVKAPKQSQVIIEPISFDSIEKLIQTCEEGTFRGDRDKAIILSLLDTGARASEFLAMNLENIDADGTITIEHGKGDKPRKVFLGKKSKKAIRRYLRHRTDNNQALWVGNNEQRLTYDGLRAIFTRRAKIADITPSPIHSFRRAFALAMLRNNVDVFSLQKILGHSSLVILRKYLAQNDEDIKQAHLLGSPVDNQERF